MTLRLVSCRSDSVTNAHDDDVDVDDVDDHVDHLAAAAVTRWLWLRGAGHQSIDNERNRLPEIVA